MRAWLDPLRWVNLDHQPGPGPDCWFTAERPDSDDRFGAGSMPAFLRIAHTVDAAMLMSSRASSPWMRRYPHVGFPGRDG